MFSIQYRTAVHEGGTKWYRIFTLVGAAGTVMIANWGAMPCQLGKGQFKLEYGPHGVMSEAAMKLMRDKTKRGYGDWERTSGGADITEPADLTGRFGIPEQHAAAAFKMLEELDGRMEKRLERETKSAAPEIAESASAISETMAVRTVNVCLAMISAIGETMKSKPAPRFDDELAPVIERATKLDQQDDLFALLLQSLTEESKKAIVEDFFNAATKAARFEFEERKRVEQEELDMIASEIAEGGGSW